MNHVDAIGIFKEKIQSSCKIKIHEDADELIRFVDELAERATNMRGQGLSQFMRTREEFIDKIEQLREEYLNLLCHHPVK